LVRKAADYGNVLVEKTKKATRHRLLRHFPRDINAIERGEQQALVGTPSDLNAIDAERKR
jgi:hypothetical protein